DTTNCSTCFVRFAVTASVCRIGLDRRQIAEGETVLRRLLVEQHVRAGDGGAGARRREAGRGVRVADAVEVVLGGGGGGVEEQDAAHACSDKVHVPELGS